MPSATEVTRPIGPGLLFVAALGEPEPAASAAVPSSWQEVGYTEDGNAISYEVTREDILVAEELDPLDSPPTARNIRVVFSMAQASIRNLSLALNAGVGRANDDADFEPPEPSDEVSVMLLHRAQSGAQWIFRQTKQVGTLEVASRKAPSKKLIASEFRVFKPETGLAPFRITPTAEGLI